ncbi:aminodeoxychorismate lyase [Actinoalloteichus caeruleus]|uniref:4-amino-4-deoxychorismate lyase n=1 Tax=Actinoalloteichus caeruleus DSM 43889 TaxID=1120930 RepID=A0ABT1JNE5_ACTCY|nr:aminodeoxychorismate lyase [Actinoalloteichus caeruleus]MCP2333206.1 4-amino-4-deoxychorismate lyase [Actinoalloteichus caeruleus DSM 43889]
MTVLALLDGTIVDHTAPLLRADDLGPLRGDGVFETILVVDGRPRELGPHLERLARSAALLDLSPPPRADWERGVEAVLGAWREPGEMALRLVCTRGVEGGDGTPTAWAMGTAVSPEVLRRREQGVSVITLDRGYAPDLVERAPWLLLGAKTLSYAVNMAALREAARRDADEVVFVATDGSVLEGPTSTVVLAEGRHLRTPPPDSGILVGTTQLALFRAAERAGFTTSVEPVGVDELVGADGLWLVSSVRQLTQVRTLDGRELPDTGTRAALHSELTDLLASEYRV